MDMHGVDTSSTELQSLESATHLYLLRCNIQGRLVIIHHAAVIYTGMFILHSYSVYSQS